MKASFFLGHRHLRVIVGVLVLHVLALWALQTGLLQRMVESVLAVQVISDVVEAPTVKEPPRPVAPPRSVVQRPAQAQQPIPLPAPLQAPQPLRSDETPQLPVAVAPPNQPGPVTAALAPAPAAASAKVELPSSDAEYLHNPKAPYPLLSQRRNEQGRVVVEVLIGVDGLALKAQIKESSGYARLDQQALSTVLSWHYVPGKRGGVPQAMTYSVPINFVLE